MLVTEVLAEDWVRNSSLPLRHVTPTVPGIIIRNYLYTIIKQEFLQKLKLLHRISNTASRAHNVILLVLK
jgi:hypothetical protein